MGSGDRCTELCSPLPSLLAILALFTWLHDPLYSRAVSPPEKPVDTKEIKGILGCPVGISEARGLSRPESTHMSPEQVGDTQRPGLGDLGLFVWKDAG